MQDNSHQRTLIALVLLAVALLIGGGAYLYQQNRKPTEVEPQTPSEREVAGEGDEQEEPTVTMPEPKLEEDQVAVYFVDLENKRGIEETFGCGDSISYLMQPVDMELTTKEKIAAAVSYLLEATDRNVGKGGLYNALYQSDLTLDRVEINGATASAYLAGTFRVGGVCDEPRVKAQLQKTVTQFDEVSNAELYINGEKLDL